MKKNAFQSRLALSLCLTLLMSTSAWAQNGNANGDWVGLGVPTDVHMSTTGDGKLHLRGNAMGTCAGVKPAYFRLDMNKPHSYMMYSAILNAANNGKAMRCVVTAGCGSSQVWFEYCYMPL